MSKFKIGAILVNTLSKKPEPIIVINYIPRDFRASEMYFKWVNYPEMGIEHTFISNEDNYCEMEVYNSPLYQALKES